MRMIGSASKLLDANRTKIDALNVFPVPDGDTGTNMSLTMQSAVKEMKAANSNRLSNISDAVARGALRGARGNSGVILSQILKGICTVIKTKEEADTRLFAKAMKNATSIAYSAVSKPKEGTMLTVSRLMSDAAQFAVRQRDFELFFKEIIEKGEEALASTPDLLPVLKKAGVVDSGGMGLLTVFKGMLKGLLGESIESEEEDAEVPATKTADETSNNIDIINLGEIEFGYCTEFFIINLKRRTTLADIDKLREYLMTIGDCVLVIGDLEFIKVHVHTNEPGVALTYALELGELDRLKIENMLEQNRALIGQKKEELKQYGLVSVCAGEGLSTIFKDLLVDNVIEGGQTMNPSTDDMLSAIDEVNADHIFILPNNKNIILAANQAQSLTDDKDIIVIPTKTVPQGITAIISYMPEADVDTNIEALEEAIKNVKTGQVTYAVRDTHIDDKEIHEGDIMGIGDQGILAVGQSVEETTKEMLAQLVDEESELISLYFGQDVLEEDAENFAQEVEALYPDVDVDVHKGGQPIYYYVLSVE